MALRRTRVYTEGSSLLGPRSQLRVIDIEDSKFGIAELWFRDFHNVALPSHSYRIPIEALWEVIYYGHSLQNHAATPEDMKKLKTWFEKLMEDKVVPRLGLDEKRMLMYPCYVFDHAKAFAAVTRALAYEVSNWISELNPSRHRELHLDGNVISKPQCS
jgi:hypothetical protein